MTQSLAESDRDASQIQYADWPIRELALTTGTRKERFQFVFKQSVLDEIHLHGQSSIDVEVCGVLLGTGRQDANGPYLLVEHCIRGSAAASKATNVTFTAETWQHIQEAMERDFPDHKMVGWYHTHPGFGIFLSEMDLFICDNFFNLPWQSAYVYDPHAGTEGNFIWRAGRPELDAVLIEDNVTPVAAAIPLISKSEALSAEQPPAAETPEANRSPEAISAEYTAKRILELENRVKRLEGRQRFLVIALCFLAAFVIMWAVLFTPGFLSNSKPANNGADKPMVDQATPTSSDQGAP